MKKIITTFATCAGLLLLAASVFAQTPAASPAATPAATKAAAGPCSEEAKAAIYTDFTTFRTSDPTKAYEAAKKYMACSQGEDQYTAYLKKWITAYDKEARKGRLNDLFINQRKYPEAYALAKEIVADEPDNTVALMDLGYGGYVLAVTTKNEANNTEAIGYAKKAIQQIEAGKNPTVWLPFKSREDALSYLYYSIGFLNRNTNPAEALTNFIKAAQFDADLKKSPQTYAFIAGAYENQYAKQSADYEAKYKDKDATDESKLAVENINQVVDRIIDAFARAVALAGTDANLAASKTQWKERLTELYKFRHNSSEAGLDQMIASVLTKPLPPVPTPITTLPSATPATNTPTSGGASNTGSATGTPVSANAPAGTAAKPAGTSTTAKPATTTTSKAPVKPRNNHRRRN